MTVTADDHEVDRAELVEALAHLVYAAKREMPVVGNDEHETPWDRRHKAINVRLTELEAMGQ